MAKLIGPLHSSEARGRMGGLVFNTWRGGATCKAKHAPAQPRTVKQLVARAFASQIARAWGAVLDAADRLTWNDYAVAHQDKDWTGTNVRLTGLNWFIRCASRLLQIGEAIIHTAPEVPAPDPPAAFAATGGAAQIVFTWTGPVTAGLFIEIWADGPHSAGRQGWLPKAQLKNRVTAADLTWTMSGLQAGTYSCWGRTIDDANGLVSTYVLGTATVT